MPSADELLLVWVYMSLLVSIVPLTIVLSDRTTRNVFRPCAMQCFTASDTSLSSMLNIVFLLAVLLVPLAGLAYCQLPAPGPVHYYRAAFNLAASLLSHALVAVRS